MLVNQYAHQSTIFQLKLQETLKEMTQPMKYQEIYQLFLMVIRITMAKYFLILILDKYKC